MNPCLIVACAINSSQKKQSDSICFSSYTPTPKPKYAVAVSIKQTKHTRVVHQYIPDETMLRFEDEIGLVELDELIYDLIEARDDLKNHIKGE